MQSKFTIIGLLGFISLLVGLLIWAIRMELSIHSIIPLAIGGVLVLAYAAINIQYLAALFTGRAAMEGANMAISIIIVLAIFVFLQIIFTKYSTIFDFTESKKYTLASQTTNLIRGLDEPVQLIYVTAAEQGGRIRDLLELYTRYSDNLTYEIVDAEKNPEKVQELAPVTLGAVYVKKGEMQEKVTQVNENNLTNALLKVVKGGNRKVYFTTGHDERSLENQDRQGIAAMGDLLKDEGYQPETVRLFETGTVPEDAIALVVAGPKTPFFEPEIEAIKNYINEGGKALFLLDPQHQVGLTEFLDENFGIVLNHDYVVEDNPLMQMFGGSPIAPMASQYGEHPIVDEMGNAVAVTFPIAQSITIEEEESEAEITPIVMTSQRSWGETNIESINQGVVEPNDEDIMGPVNLAVAVSKPVDIVEEATPEKTLEDLAETTEEENVEMLEDQPEARMVVYGDSDFISNAYYQTSMNLFLNSVNWLAKQEDQISIRAKEDFGQPVIVSRLQANVIFFTALFIIPGIVAIFGAVIIIRKSLRG